MVIILGAKGMLGGQLMRRFENAIGWDREDVNVLEFDQFRDKVMHLNQKPETIINCVAFNDVDGAEDRPDAAFALNAEFVGRLAALGRELGIPVVHFSTNYVFDGAAGEYAEDAEPNPLSAYGKSKREGELALKAHTDYYYLVRTAVLFGPKGESELSKKSFVELMLSLSEKQSEIKAVSDEINSLTYVSDLADAVKTLVANKKPYGIYHVTDSGQASWYDFAREVFAITGRDVHVLPVPGSTFPRKAARPHKSVLVTTKLEPLRSWQEALKEFLGKANSL